MRAQATWVALLWTLGEQGRVLQGQGVSHQRSCLHAKEFAVPGSYFLVVQDGDCKFSE
jgi:hypothetical protein